MNPEVCWKINDLEEEVLKRVVFKLGSSLEPRYLDFLKKYLKACMRIYPSNNGTIKFCFFDDRRNIYYWVPLINGEKRSVKDWEEVKKILVRRIAGVVRHTFARE